MGVKYNIIGSVQVTSSPGEVQTYNSNFKNRIHADPITFISIAIYNQDFNVVNFNSIDWFLNLSFSFIYKKKLELPQYLSSYNTETNMSYYIQEEENRNLNRTLDTIIDENKFPTDYLLILETNKNTLPGFCLVITLIFNKVCWIICRAKIS